MSSFTPAGSGGAVVVTQGVSNPTVTNIPLAIASTEVQIVLPANCQRFRFKLRDAKRLQFTFASGSSGTTFFTLPPGCVHEESAIESVPNIYVQSPAPGQVLELLTWI